MKVLAVVVALLAVGAYSKVIAPPDEIISPEETTAYNYHEKVGIPEAERIRLAEEQMLSDPSRIVGGSISGWGQNPYQAGILVLLNNGWTSVCGAAKLSYTSSITAAHCWWDGQSQASRFTVVLGTLTIFNGGTRVETVQVTMHPSWNPWTITSDIAMIRHNWIGHNNNIQPIALPYGNELNNNYVGWAGVVSGWGRTSDTQSNIPNNQHLWHVTLQIIANAVCAQTFGSNTIVASTLCTSGAGGVGICGGDSGGPLTVVSNGRKILVGVASFGAQAGCQSGYPSAFARVSYFTQWIIQFL